MTNRGVMCACAVIELHQTSLDFASLTDIERGILLLDVVVDVGHAERLHGRRSYSQQDLGPDQQQIHHVGVGFVVTQFILHQLGLHTGGVQAHVSPSVRPQLFHILVLFRQELWQRGEKRAQRHHDAPAANQTRAVGLGPEVADEQDQGQVADLEAAGDHPDVGALEVEAALQGGQNAHLREEVKHERWDIIALCHPTS